MMRRASLGGEESIDGGRVMNWGGFRGPMFNSHG